MAYNDENIYYASLKHELGGPRPSLLSLLVHHIVIFFDVLSLANWTDASLRLAPAGCRGGAGWGRRGARG